MSETDMEKRINLQGFKEEITQRMNEMDELNTDIDINKKKIEKLNRNDIKELNKIKKTIDKYLIDNCNKYNRDFKNFKRFDKLTLINFITSLLLLGCYYIANLSDISIWFLWLVTILTAVFLMTSYFILWKVPEFEYVEMLEYLKSRFDYFRNTIVSLSLIMSSLLAMNNNAVLEINGIKVEDNMVQLFKLISATVPVAFILFSGLTDSKIKRIKLEKKITE